MSNATPASVLSRTRSGCACVDGCHCGPDEGCLCSGLCSACEDALGSIQADGRYLCEACLEAEEAAEALADLATEAALADTLPAPAMVDDDERRDCLGLAVHGRSTRRAEERP